jgi:site-specific DNA-methyltransferase (cytosine-N4-specific)
MQVAGDCLELMKLMPDNSVDLVFTSPPYEDARTYGVGFKLRGEDWVKWMYERCVEMARVCKGVVCINCEGKTRGFNYSATPFLLLADLKRAGYAMRKPLAFYRKGIPGSGGPDWFRNDWEPVICFQQSKGKLAWSDKTAMGHKPRWAPGGAMSNRHANGKRVNSDLSNRNKWGTTPSNNYRTKERRQNGERALEPKVAAAVSEGLKPGQKLHTKNNGSTMRVQCYDEPVLANPGNVIKCIVGGGVMGSPLAHENEAPFPEKLAEFFIRSLCPPGGIVLDPFCGSGTVAAVAKRTGRRWICYDLRQSQIDLTERRLATVQPELLS